MIITKGRYVTGYRVASTEMLRLASSKLLGFYGGNHQNPSESLMRCVIPEDGNIFVSPDQAGAEALVVAMECRPGRMRKLFELGIKPHSYMALQLFTDRFKGDQPAARYKAVDPAILASYPECKALLNLIKNAVREYFLGKKTIHSFNYQEGPRTFQLTTLEESGGTIVLSFKESKEFHSIWAATFNEVVEWQGETIARQKRDRLLRNLFGYPRRFERNWNDSVERQGLAYVPQSTVAAVTHKAFTSLYKRIKQERLPWRLLNNKHDSFLLECPENHKDQAIAYSKEHMGQELKSSRGEIYRMKVGVSVGRNWGHYDEAHNKDGLKEL